MIIRKTVAFNLVDPDQKAMLEHADLRPNFSGYIKRLIQRDMDNMQKQVTEANTAKNKRAGAKAHSSPK